MGSLPDVVDAGVPVASAVFSVVSPVLHAVDVSTRAATRAICLNCAFILKNDLLELNVFYMINDTRESSIE
ncbi:hypothetical protein D3C85_1840890 [compost metagenome]